MLQDNPRWKVEAVTTFTNFASKKKTHLSYVLFLFPGQKTRGSLYKRTISDRPKFAASENTTDQTKPDQKASLSALSPAEIVQVIAMENGPKQEI
jgi:hypothetical protein